MAKTNPASMTDSALRREQERLRIRAGKVAKAIWRLEDERRAIEVRRSVLNMESKRRLTRVLDDERRSPAPFGSRRKRARRR